MPGLTYIGGPTAIIEIGGLRLLTDPTFDPAGGRYNFGWGTGSTKTQGPAVAVDALGEIDAILLSHDHHDDNLDQAGRSTLGKAEQVLTTRSGAKRLDANAKGLAPWESVEIDDVRITAAPARHGIPGSRPFVGEVIGFVLESDDADGALYVTGDSVWFRGVAEVGARFELGTAVVHLGGVRFPLYGPARFTMNSREAVKLFERLGPKRLVPLHFEGWAHFKEGREKAERVFEQAGISDSVAWPAAGERLSV